MGTTLRLLFYNAFLLRLLLPWPRGGWEIAGTPACGARAVELGRTLAGQYEIAALCEVFDEYDRRTVLSGWHGRTPAHAAGPSSTRVPLIRKSSGLLTIVDGPALVRSATHAFENRGSYRRDADAYANKGVLLAEIEAGSGANIELYSTHLIVGNDFWKRPGGTFGANAEMRRRQLDELLDFVRRTHHPGNVALIVGDFNQPAIDPEAESPEEGYELLR